jgi:putative peptidoglycan lipid II flippase
VGALLTGYALGWLRPGAAPSAGRAALPMFWLMAPGVVAATVAAVYAGGLASTDEFRWPVGSLALRALGVFAAVAAFDRTLGIASVALGYAVGDLTRAAVLRHVFLRRTRTAADAPPGAAPGVVVAEGSIRRVGHQLGSMTILSTGALVERGIATGLGVGAVSALDYASKLFFVPSALFDSNVASVFLSTWSRLAAAGQWAVLRDDVRRTRRRVLAATSVIAAGAIAAREPVVRVVLGHGAFDAGDVTRVASIFGVFMLCFPLAVVGLLTERAIMAMGEQAFLLRSSMLKVAVRCAAATLLAPRLGAVGIAAGLLAVHGVESVLHLWVLPRRYRARLAEETTTAPHPLALPGGAPAALAISAT